MTEVITGKDAADVSLECVVSRSRIFNGKNLTVPIKTTVFLTLARNDDLTVNGRYPMVVTRYEIRWQESVVSR